MKKYVVDKNKIPIVCDLDLAEYLGKWYEIGRLSAKAQQGFDDVTATYTLKSKMKIRVYNEGYKRNKKKSISGSAWVRNKKCSGALYVRFFWPFKAEYNVIKVASDYRYAVVMGDSTSSLWILSKTQHIDHQDYQDIIQFLDTNKFNTKKIKLTTQNRSV
jgi:apolipoprotein D and lipocalin family protein